MIKKGLTLLFVVMITVMLSPFNIQAETVGGSSPIIGVNITVTDYEYNKVPYQATVSFTNEQTRWQCMSSHSSMGCQAWQSQGTDGVVDDEITGTITYSSQSVVEGYLYEYDFVFDKGYVGSITFSDGSIGGTTTKTYFVNGSHLVLTSTQFITAFTVSSYNLNALPDNMKKWDFPIESFSAVSTAMGTLPIVDYFQYYNYIYPIFSITQNDILFNINVSANGDVYLVYFLSGRITTDTMSRYLEWSEGYTIKEYSFIRSGTYNGRNGTFYRVVISWDTGGFKTLKFIGTSTYDFIPIYAYGNNGYVSTDFALLWGLNNRLLDDLDIIANGTTASSSAAQSNDSANSQLQTSSNQLFTQEDSFKSDMNNAMQNIPSFSVNNFGNKFMSSATWVRQQYERMTNNTPFQQVITFSLLVGLSMILIGKVRK